MTFIEDTNDNYIDLPSSPPIKTKCQKAQKCEHVDNVYVTYRLFYKKQELLTIRNNMD